MQHDAGMRMSRLSPFPSDGRSAMKHSHTTALDRMPGLAAGAQIPDEAEVDA
jgi:hypothetical protein